MPCWLAKFSSAEILHSARLRTQSLYGLFTVRKPEPTSIDLVYT